MNSGPHAPTNGDSSSSDDAGSETASVYTARTSLEEDPCPAATGRPLEISINHASPLEPASHAQLAALALYTHVLPPFPLPGDWKHHNPRRFGNQLRHGRYQVRKNDILRSYDIYLFERIFVLIAFESHPTTARHVPAVLKGRIFTQNIVDVRPDLGSHSLTIDWADASPIQSFSMLFPDNETMQDWQLALLVAQAAAGPPVLTHAVHAAIAAGHLPYVPGSVPVIADPAVQPNIVDEAPQPAADDDDGESDDEDGIPADLIQADQAAFDGPARPFRALPADQRMNELAVPMPKQGFVIDLSDEPRHTPWPHLEAMHNARDFGRLFRRSRLSVDRRGACMACDVYLYEVALLVVENPASSKRAQVDRLVYMLDIVDVYVDFVQSQAQLRLSWLSKTTHHLILQSKSLSLLEEWKDDILCLISDRLFCDIHCDDTLLTPSCGKLLLNDDFSIVSISTWHYRVLLYEKAVIFCKVTYPTVGEDDNVMPVYQFAKRIPIESIVETGGLLDRSPKGIETYWLSMRWSLQGIERSVRLKCRRRETLGEWTSHISKLANGPRSS